MEVENCLCETAKMANGSVYTPKFRGKYRNTNMIKFRHVNVSQSAHGSRSQQPNISWNPRSNGTFSLVSGGGVPPGPPLDPPMVCLKKVEIDLELIEEILHTVHWSYEGLPNQSHLNHQSSFTNKH